MAQGLIIVESPAKARTLKRFLGNRFDVLASMGHVRDLPERELAVDVDRDFQPRYEVVDSRKQTISDLKKAVQKRPEVILASDPHREEEIRSFVTEESWTVDAVLSKELSDPRFKARLARRLAEPDAKLELKTEADARAAIAELEGAEYRVASIERRQRSKSAPAPYITSTLQQDASSRLRFSPKKTMRLAQDLYEGVELGPEGSTGLITYMRTDSTKVSDEAEAGAAAWIKRSLGEKYLGKARQQKSRPGAQEAHEAIRPTDPSRRPEDIQRFLSPDQYRVYELIWRRFMASRMAAAQYALTTVEIEAGAFGLRAN